MKHKLISTLSLLAAMGAAGAAQAEGITAKYLAVEDGFFAVPHPLFGPWAQLPAVPVTLMPQGITTPSKSTPGPTTVEARAAHNGKWLAVEVSWADASSNNKSATSQFSDGVAMSIPLKDPAATSPFMGSKGAEVSVIYWKALWQRDMVNGYQEVTDLYPNAFTEGYHNFYPPKETIHGLATSKEVWANPGSREANPALVLNSPMTQPDRTTPVEQLIAEGFSTLTTQRQQDAKGWGVYKDGKWHVVFTLPLKSGDTADPALVPGGVSAINFAVWDGGVEDRGARKSYSMFTPLTLEKSP